MKFFLLMNTKMPTVVGILIFLSSKKASRLIPSLQKPEFIDIFMLMSFLKFMFS